MEFDYQSYQNQQSQPTQETPKYDNEVGFFTLKEDGAESIVRIMLDSMDQFKVFTTHPYTINGKPRQVSCSSDPKDPSKRCSMCEAGVPVQQKFYMPLLVYNKQPDGSYKPVPQLWDRSPAYIKRVLSLLQEYGPLSQCIFKIKRHGAPGDTRTTYDIIYGAPQVYTDAIFPNTGREVFDNFKILGTIVAEFDEPTMEELIKNGGRLAPKSKPQNSQAPTNQSYNTYNQAPQAPASAWTSSQGRVYQTYQQQQPTNNWETPQNDNTPPWTSSQGVKRTPQF